MATQLCQKCKQSHPGSVCDSDEKGECAETTVVTEITEACDEPSKKQERSRIVTSAKQEVHGSDEPRA
jgi:hypothetical protein